MFQLCKALDKKVKNLSIICLDDSVNRDDNLSKLFVVSNGRDPLNNFIIPSHRAAKIAGHMEGAYDIFHSNIGFGYPYAFRKNKKPFILQIRGNRLQNIGCNIRKLDRYSYFNSIFDLIIWNIERLTAIKSTMILCNSEETCKSNKFNIFNNNINILNNGTYYFESAKKPDPNYITLGCLSRLEYGKNNLFKFIKIIDQLKNELPNIRLLIAGSGSLERELREEIKRFNLEKHIFLLGHVNNKEISSFYNIVDINLPSTPGRTLIEGIAYNTPYILLVNEDEPIGVSLKLLESSDCGIVLKNPDQSKIVDSILKYINDERWKSVDFESHRQKLLMHFDWTNIADQLIKYYEECL
jgi:glycosyltransferase involved in cell wall biosynthesis